MAGQSDEEWEPRADEPAPKATTSSRRKSKYDLAALDAQKAAITGEETAQPEEASNAGVKPKRIRGAGPASPDKRRAQNRQAQQNFRQRRENYVKELEKRLEVEADTHARLRAQLAWLHQRAGPSVMATMTDASPQSIRPPGSAGSSYDSGGERPTEERAPSRRPQPTSLHYPPMPTASSFEPPSQPQYSSYPPYDLAPNPEYHAQHYRQHLLGHADTSSLLSQAAPRPLTSLGGYATTPTGYTNGYSAPPFPSNGYGAPSAGHPLMFDGYAPTNDPTASGSGSSNTRMVV